MSGFSKDYSSHRQDNTKCSVQATLLLRSKIILSLLGMTPNVKLWAGKLEAECRVLHV